MNVDRSELAPDVENFTFCTGGGLIERSWANLGLANNNNSASCSALIPRVISRRKTQSQTSYDAELNIIVDVCVSLPS